MEKMYVVIIRMFKLASFVALHVVVSSLLDTSMLLSMVSALSADAFQALCTSRWCFRKIHCHINAFNALHYRVRTCAISSEEYRLWENYKRWYVKFAHNNVFSMLSIADWQKELNLLSSEEYGYWGNYKRWWYMKLAHDSLCDLWEKEHKREPSLKWYTVTRILKEACCIFCLSANEQAIDVKIMLYKRHSLSMHLDRSRRVHLSNCKSWIGRNSHHSKFWIRPLMSFLYLKTRKALLCRIEAFWKYLGVWRKL